MLTGGNRKDEIAKLVDKAKTLINIVVQTIYDPQPRYLTTQILYYAKHC